jgi:hypothetical protein
MSGGHGSKGARGENLGEKGAWRVGLGEREEIAGGTQVVGSGLVDRVSRAWPVKEIRIDSDFRFYSFSMVQKRKKSRKYLEASEKYEILPWGIIDHLEQLSFWSLDWVATDFE